MSQTPVEVGDETSGKIVEMLSTKKIKWVGEKICSVLQQLRIRGRLQRGVF